LPDPAASGRTWCLTAARGYRHERSETFAKKNPWFCPLH
jgi:hypothetical protein